MSEYDCVVVGGGLIGACCAYELIQHGAGRVAIVEQENTLGEGTSSTYAGNVFMAAAGYIAEFGRQEYELEKYGFEFYRQLHEYAADAGLHNVGSLFLACTPDALESLIADFSGPDAVPSQQILDPGEIRDLCGTIDSTATAGAVYHPQSGWLSAQHATAALSRLIKSRGGTIQTGTRVTDFLIENGSVTGVETSAGHIAAKHIAIAAGAWTNEILKTIGIQIPMIPVAAARVMAESPVCDPSMPVILVKERGFYLRAENEGLLFGGAFTRPPRFDLLSKAPPAAFDGCPIDGVLELISKAKKSADFFPGLEKLSKITFRYGAPCHTSDRRGILGPMRSVPGLYLAGGCNEAGVMHAPGFGKAIAEFITQGETTLPDPEVCDPERFGLVFEAEQRIALAQQLFKYRPDSRVGA